MKLINIILFLGMFMSTISTTPVSIDTDIITDNIEIRDIIPMSPEEIPKLSDVPLEISPNARSPVEPISLDEGVILDLPGSFDFLESYTGQIAYCIEVEEISEEITGDIDTTITYYVYFPGGNIHGPPRDDDCVPANTR
jgi:hypothetical protein